MEVYRCPTCVAVLREPLPARCETCGQSLRRRKPQRLGASRRITVHTLPIDRWMLTNSPGVEEHEPRPEDRAPAPVEEPVAVHAEAEPEPDLEPEVQAVVNMLYEHARAESETGERTDLSA